MMATDSAPGIMVAPPARAGLPGRFGFTAPPALGLYLHVPWCERKCPYCDFNSHEAGGAIPAADYIDALIADLEQDLPLIWGRTVDTVFIGGGTPSLLPPEQVDRLLSALRALLALGPAVEITLEANPGTVDAVRLRELRDAGINRISLGVQSLDDRLLERIGRIHDAAGARAAAAGIRDAGFDSWNIDLMYGLPGQDTAQALSDLEAAIELGAPHISHYQLTIEPNTAFHHRPPVLPDDDTLWEMQQASQGLFEGHGLAQYEVSAWSRPDHQCRHNLNYWRFGDYLGIGAGAHAKLTDAPAQAVNRYSRLRHPRDYLHHAHGAQRIAEQRVLTPDDAALEFMMNALRLNDGFAPALFADHAGLPLALLETPLATAEQRGLITRDLERIRPTPLGRRYLNDLLALFMSDD